MTRNNGFTVAVIGGGAAGMLACGVAAESADRVILIEKNKLLGKKLRITGKGRCNITNNADIEDFIKNVPTNPKFLYSAFYSFTNTDTIELFNSLGVKTKLERGGRIFPESDSAHEVAEALKRFALKRNVTLMQTEALEILTEDGRVCGVRTGKGTVEAEAVLLATGGKSYPLTGSDGSGYTLAQQLGHTIVPPKPSLIPIVTEEKWVSELMGLSLKNTELSLYRKNKKIYTDFGEMLFTHFGISGPIVLSASAHMRDLGKENYKIMLDLKPALDFDKLDRRICRDFSENKNRHLINALDKLLPKALIPVIIELSGIPPHKAVNSITQQERAALVRTIKELTLTPKCFRPIEEAIITSGGIRVGEINPSTMESVIVKGLFFAGEIIDVDAYTGGFNLQIAFSTAHLAAEEICRRAEETADTE